MDTKTALDRAQSFAAAHTNRLHSLAAIAASPLLTDEQFFTLVGQAKSTIARDLQNAHDEFVQAKENYETHCREIGVPAYATWNED